MSQQDNKKSQPSDKDEDVVPLEATLTFKTKFSPGFICMWLAIIGVYLFIRCFKITALPFFGDEALYLHWARMIQKNPADMFISQCDNKAPFYFILNSLFYSVDNPLLIGRLLAVAIAACGLILLSAICSLTISKRAGWYGAILYTFSYFLFLNDCQVNPEVLVGTLTLAVIWTSIKFEQTEKSIWIIFLGLFMGLGILTKLSMYAIWPFPLFLLFLKGKHGQIIQLWKGYLIAALFVILKALSPQSQAFTSFHHFLSFSDLLSFPADAWRSNISTFLEIITFYIGWPIFLLMIVGLYLSVSRRNRYVTGVGIFSFSMLALMLFITKGTLYPRYFPMVVCSALIPAVFAVEWLHEKYLKKAWIFAVFLVLINIQSFYSMVQYWKSPIDAPWCSIDKFQFFHGTFSGTGIKELEDFFEKEAKTHGIHVFTLRTMGPPLDSLAVGLEHNRNIIIVPTTWFPPEPILNKDKVNFLPKSPFQLHQPGNKAIAYEEGSFLYIKKLNGDMSHAEPTDIYMNIPIRHAYFTALEARMPEDVFQHLNPGAVKVFEVIKPGGDPKMEYYVFKLKTVQNALK